MRRLTARPYRVVEAQHVVATRKLVDSLDEQRLLEDMLERAKPPLPREPECGGLHYLLSTPFRYPPLRHGSRFASRAERSPWYGATRRRTAFAESAYYRLVFLDATEAELSPLEAELTCFRAAVRTTRGVDLTRPPFDADLPILASPTRYEATQALGAAMRASGVEAFRYASARDPDGGSNLGVFTPRAFASPIPEPAGVWHVTATRARVEIRRFDLFERAERFVFERSVFEVEGHLPAPAT